MAKLIVKGLKITFPDSIENEPTDAQILEWLEFSIGLSFSIANSNPLCDIDMSDCNVSADECIINDKPIKL